MTADAPDEEPPRDAPRRWVGPAVFFAFVAAVVSGASAVASRHRALHGADLVTGLYVDARFAPPPSLAGARTVSHDATWPLAPGSGSLRVRFETVSRGRASAVTAARVEPGARVLDGVEARVRVTGYETSATADDGRAIPVGRVALECVERAADGEHVHRIELRGDGTTADPDAVR